MEIIRDKDGFKVINTGVLLVKDNSYNNIILAIEKIKERIDDEYQLNILDQILYKISREVA